MISHTFLGVDPGETGAIAILPEHDHGLIKFYDYMSPPDLADAYDEIEVMFGPVLAVLESVNSFNMGRQSAFVFGENFGAHKMAMLCHRIPFKLVAPRAWQKTTCGAHKPRLTKAQKTLRVYAWLRTQHPGINFKTPRGKILDGRVDALAMAHKARQLYRGAV